MVGPVLSTGRLTVRQMSWCSGVCFPPAQHSTSMAAVCSRAWYTKQGLDSEHMVKSTSFSLLSSSRWHAHHAACDLTAEEYEQLHLHHLQHMN